MTRETSSARRRPAGDVDDRQVIFLADRPVHIVTECMVSLPEGADINPGRFSCQ